MDLLCAWLGPCGDTRREGSSRGAYILLGVMDEPWDSLISLEVHGIHLCHSMLFLISSHCSAVVQYVDLPRFVCVINGWWASVWLPVGSRSVPCAAYCRWVSAPISVVFVPGRSPGSQGMCTFDSAEVEVCLRRARGWIAACGATKGRVALPLQAGRPEKPYCRSWIREKASLSGGWLTQEISEGEDWSP